MANFSQFIYHFLSVKQSRALVGNEEKAFVKREILTENSFSVCYKKLRWQKHIGFSYNNN
jgi:hypothetical protein